MNKQTYGRTDKRKDEDENYIPLGINARGITTARNELLYKFNSLTIFSVSILLAKSDRLFCQHACSELYGPRQANLVLIAYASSEGSGEPAHPRSLARTFAARSYKQ